MPIFGIRSSGFDLAFVYNLKVYFGLFPPVPRDVNGNLLTAQCVYVPCAANVVTMKAMAMRDGLTLANSLEFHHVEAESDSLIVIDFCTGQSRWWDASSAIFTKCVDTSVSIGKVNTSRKRSLIPVPEGFQSWFWNRD